jgi:hypothetical protein
MKTRKELKQDYRNLKPPMGVFVIRNLTNGRFLLHASLNLTGGMNRLKVEITPSTAPNVELLRDWKTMGPEAFEIRVLDVLEPRDVPGWDPKDDLKELKALWQARLLAEGGTPY